MYKSCENARYLKLVVIHYIIGWQVRYRKYLALSCVIEWIMSTMNFFCSGRLNHHCFCEVSEEIDADFPYHTAVNRLAAIKFSCDFWIQSWDWNFFKQEPPSTIIIEWLCKLALLSWYWIIKLIFNIKYFIV